MCLRRAPALCTTRSIICAPRMGLGPTKPSRGQRRLGVGTWRAHVAGMRLAAWQGGGEGLGAPCAAPQRLSAVSFAMPSRPDPACRRCGPRRGMALVACLARRRRRRRSAAARAPSPPGFLPSWRGHALLRPLGQRRCASCVGGPSGGGRAADTPSWPQGVLGPRATSAFHSRALRWTPWPQLGPAVD